MARSPRLRMRGVIHLLSLFALTAWTRTTLPLDNKQTHNVLTSSQINTSLSTGWRTKYHTIDCAHNTFLLLQKHLTPGTELILIGWKIVPNEEHVQCDHRFASQPLARVRLQEVVRQNGGHNEHGLH